MKWFLIEVYHKNKSLFLLFVLFILGQSFFSYKGIQNFPFMLYGMYSAPMTVKDQYSTFRLKVNGEWLDPHTQAYCPDEFLQYQWRTYHFLSQHKDPVQRTIKSRFGSRLNKEQLDFFFEQLSNDQEAVDAYLPWLSQYLERIMDTKIFSLELYQVTSQYATDSLTQTNSKRIAIYQSTSSHD